MKNNAQLQRERALVRTAETDAHGIDVAAYAYFFI